MENRKVDFKKGVFEFDDCIRDGDFTPGFREYLEHDTIGRMYLNGFIRQSKETFVKLVLKALADERPLDGFVEFMRPYVERLEREAGCRYNAGASRWRHCNDLAMARSTLQFDKEDGSVFHLCVFESRPTGKVDMDVFSKGPRGAGHWSHVDRRGIRAGLDDYFGDIVEFCK